MATLLIKNGKLVNEGKIEEKDILIINDKIEQIGVNLSHSFAEVIDAKGNYVLPGAIDDQVHFREPGLTHKANLFTESRAAVAGGITSFMEMPNTVPNTLTQELLEDKYQIAAKSSLANYSFFMGASNENIEEVLKTDPKSVCGVKVFMGSSTGNMLVDNEITLTNIFSKCKMLIATHCEDEATIRKNIAEYKEKYGDDIPMEYHPTIRSEEACYISSSLAVSLAKKHNTRLHVLHISTAKELSLFNDPRPLGEKKITAEACIHHMWFDDSQYKTKGSRIKWNPAVKTAKDRDAILQAVNDNVIDVIATDHAPHTIEEKDGVYTKAASGGPLVQHALLAMFELYKEGKIELTHIVKKFSHDLATCFQIDKRGYLREGYYADIVIANLDKKQTVTKESLLYKCGWSPFEGEEFSSTIETTIVSGNVVWNNGNICEGTNGQRLSFNR
ncbi:dihydroorotase [Flavobacteriales bacterium]|nr:dihydroorotase [Flavobacteriales bacterium]